MRSKVNDIFPVSAERSSHTPDDPKPLSIGEKRRKSPCRSIRAVKQSQLTARIAARIEPNVKKSVTRLIERAEISLSQYLNNVLKYASRPNMPLQELRFFTARETHAARKFQRKDRAS